MNFYPDIGGPGIMIGAIIAQFLAMGAAGAVVGGVIGYNIGKKRGKKNTQVKWTIGGALVGVGIIAVWISLL